MQEIVKRRLILYRDNTGSEPFVVWLESLRDIATRARIKHRVRRIELGNLGDYRSIGKELLELRLHFGSGYRVYVGIAGMTAVVLLCGGDKRSQKKDIQKAKNYWELYKRS